MKDTITADVSQDKLAALIRSAYADIAAAARKLGTAIDWQPLGKGRSALNQLHECIHLAHIGTGVLQTGQFTFNPADRARLAQQNPPPESTFPTLADAAETYAKAIETASSEDLNQTILLPFGSGTTKTIAEVVLLVYWNAVYHEGQINYIETLLPMGGLPAEGAE